MGRASHREAEAVGKRRRAAGQAHKRCFIPPCPIIFIFDVAVENFVRQCGCSGITGPYAENYCFRRIGKDFFDFWNVSFVPIELKKNFPLGEYDFFWSLDRIGVIEMDGIRFFQNFVAPVFILYFRGVDLVAVKLFQPLGERVFVEYFFHGVT